MGPEGRPGRLLSLFPVAASVGAGAALALLLPGRLDPAVFVARVLAIVTGSAVVLVTAGLLPELGRPFGGRPSPDPTRWRARPVHAFAVRAVVIGVPIAASLAIALLLDDRLPRAQNGSALLLRLVVVMTCSYVVLYVVERALRRLGPLAMLLKLSMAFPGAAPSRLKVASMSGNPQVLQRRLEDALQREDADGVEFASTILSLVAALTSHDRRTRGHSERVRAFTDLLAEELRLDNDARDRLRWTALLHDVGKLTISPRILNKPGPLDRKQWEIMHRHPAEGARIVAPLAPWLGEWAASVEQHHEHWDGTGYPNGLAGEQLQLGARVISVADAYDTMTAARPYQAARTPAAAREEIARNAGTHFDPLVARALLNVSIRRLWWRMGVAGWLAQLPLLGRIPQLAAPASQVASGVRTATAVAGVAAISALPVLGEPAPSSVGTAVASTSEASPGQGGTREGVRSDDGGSRRRQAEEEPRRKDRRDDSERERGEEGGTSDSSGASSGTGSDGAEGGNTPSGSGGSGGGGTPSGSGETEGGGMPPIVDDGITDGLGPPWNNGGGTGWGAGNGQNEGQGADNANTGS